MIKRAVAPWEPVAGLFGDEFSRDAAYSNWRPAGSGDWLLIYTDAGAGRLVSPVGPYDTREGDAVLYAPGEMHDYSTAPSPGQWRLLWVHFTPTPAWQPWLRWPVSPTGLRLLHLEPGDAREHFTTAMRRMIGVLRREIPGARDLAANALEEALLWANVVASKDGWMKMDDRVRKAVDYLVAHSREPIRLTPLSRHCGASVSRLAFLFKQQTGYSPHQFLERCRLQHAGQLLRLTGLSIAEIAAEVGYDDPFYFSNRFRRFTGQSPSNYRVRGEVTSLAVAATRRGA